MNRIFYIFIVALFFIGCGKKEEPKETLYPETELSAADKQIARGKELFDGGGNCVACHRPDQKIIGPSIIEIAKIYKEQNGDIPAFLREKAEPIVDPSQYSVMKTNFAITKKMSEADLEALEAYIFSYLKE